MTAAGQIIEFFAMKPLLHEGGYYVETYRSPDKIGKAALPEKYAGERNLATAILYLVTPEAFSALHRIISDEIFHFYLGDPVTMLQLHPDATTDIITLGHDILNGQRIQVTVPAGTWQGCFLNDGGRFALMGTTVAPGFESADFELAGRAELLEKYANQRDLILRLTREH
ncbi:MAG: cupin domain-containing protein [Planctomycetota bacterium]|jgi:predicted cupin superfamily sugar epimerase